MTNELEPSVARREERVLLLAAPRGDAELISSAAAEGGFVPELASDMACLCAAIREGAGLVVLVDADFSTEDVAALRETLRAQEPWSDLPILLLPADVERNEARGRMLDLVALLDPVGCVNLAERPLENRMLISRIADALRARRRQYATRALLAQLDLERRRELAVLAALPVGTLVTDAQGRVLQTNAAFVRIWGAMPAVESVDDAHVLRGWLAGTDHRSKPFEVRFKRVLATGEEVIDEELEIEAFDGARRTILASSFPVRGARGELMGAVAVQVDITERARAQRAREILSEATAALIESLEPDVTLGTLSRLVVTNLADCCAIDELDERGELRRLLAETSGAPTADEAARLLAFVPAPGGNSLVTRVLKSGKPILLSEVPGDWFATGLEAHEHRAAFAKIGAYSLMVVPLIARGRPLGVLGIVSTRRDRRYDARDLALAEEIGRRAAIALDNARLHRQTEAALRARDQSLAEFDAFVAASPVGFAVLDRALRYRRMNCVLARWTGVGADEVIGRALEDVVPRALEAQMAPLLRRVLVTGASLVDQAIVGSLLRGSEKTRHLSSSYFPLLDVDGTPRAVGAVVTDVTRLTEVEEELREEAALRERFIGVLAHDLRTPLQAIALSATSLLRRGDAPPAWEHTLGRVARAADRMGRMIGNLLDLARSRQGGGIVVSRTATDLAAIVRAVVEELEASHPGREIEVSVHGDTRAELDADRMAEVVSNLVGNALAYSPPGTAVRVELSGTDGELALTVHNSGAPIPPEKLTTIFAPFQRGHVPGSEAPAIRGLGLGLFIVGEITRAHGGAVEATSTAETGTTFTVRVPRASAPPAAASAA